MVGSRATISSTENTFKILKLDLYMNAISSHVGYIDPGWNWKRIHHGINAFRLKKKLCLQINLFVWSFDSGIEKKEATTTIDSNDMQHIDPYDTLQLWTENHNVYFTINCVFGLEKSCITYDLKRIWSTTIYETVCLARLESQVKFTMICFELNSPHRLSYSTFIC